MTPSCPEDATYEGGIERGRELSQPEIKELQKHLKWALKALAPHVLNDETDFTTVVCRLCGGKGMYSDIVAHTPECRYGQAFSFL
jgi:hypothetical protein